MKNLDSFNKICFTLSKEDIFELNKLDNGAINNVISGIERQCFGARIYDDKYGLTVEMFYINSDKQLKGDIIRLEINDQNYSKLLFRFCELLANDYENIDTIDAFNTYQTKLRTFLEKLGFFTTTSNELKRYKGKNAIMMTSSQRGMISIDFIDKVEFLMDFFNNKESNSELEKSKEYVYLMVNTQTSLIKIGTSKNPIYREKTLHSQEPSVYLIVKWKCNKEIEKKLHKKYQHKRKRGEWFKLSMDDLKEIKLFMNNIVNNCN